MLLAAVFGFVAAVFVFGTRELFRKFLMAVAICALVLPPFLVVNCWLHFFGLNGSLRWLLPVNLYSMAGVVWILALLYWPIPFLLTLSAWENIEPAQLESEPRLVGFTLLRWVLWPVAKSSLAQAGSIVV